MEKFRAYRIDEKDGKIVTGFQELGVDDLTEGNVVVKVSHSTINFKDALAATGVRTSREDRERSGLDSAGCQASPDPQGRLVGPMALTILPRGLDDELRLDSRGPQVLDRHLRVVPGLPGGTRILRGQAGGHDKPIATLPKFPGRLMHRDRPDPTLHHQDIRLHPLRLR